MRVRAEARVERGARLHGHDAGHGGIAEGGGVGALGLGIRVADGVDEEQGAVGDGRAEARGGQGAAGGGERGPGVRLGRGVGVLDQVRDHLAVVVRHHPVAPGGEVGFERVGVGDVAVVGPHERQLAGGVVGLAVHVRDGAVGGPAHLADEALAGFPVNAQLRHYAAGRPHLLQQLDAQIGADERRARGIVAPVFQPLQELAGLMPQGGIGGSVAEGHDPAHG